MKQSTTNWDISGANDLLLALKDELKDLSLPQLGPSFKKMSGVATADALVAHRIIKKFERPSDDNTRAEKSIAAMLQYDQGGFTAFEPARMGLDPFVRQTLYNARNQIHEVLSAFRLCYDSVEIPNGESFDSAKGDTSIVAKLRSKCHWKVTPDCFELFCKIVYHNRGLRRAAKSHFRVRSNTFHKRLFALVKEKYGSHAAPYQCFRLLFRKDVVTLWYGSRLATVPKNTEVDRVIEVECLGNMIVQRTIASSLKKCINNFFDLDLAHAQDLHKAMIRDHENATIDWQNASNSNWRPVVKWFFPKKVFDLLDTARAPVVSYSDDFYGLNMLSPMGNGCTFEVMTLFLLSIARTLDSYAMVFGDDVIIHRDCATAYIEAVCACGWSVNESKTFIDGNFRESCGAFHHVDLGYIRSYDFHWIEDSVDLMIAANKLYYIIDAKQVSPQMSKILRQYHSKLVLCCASFALRTDCMPHFHVNANSFVTNKIGSRHYSEMDRVCISQLNQPNLEMGVVVSRSTYRRSMVTSEERKLFNTFRGNVIFADLQVEPIAVCRIPYKTVEKYSRVPLDNVRSKFWIAQYLYTMRCDAPNKGKTTRVRNRTVAFYTGGSINMDDL